MLAGRLSFYVQTPGVSPRLGNLDRRSPHEAADVPHEGLGLVIVVSPVARAGPNGFARRLGFREVHDPHRAPEQSCRKAKAKLPHEGR